MKNLLLATWLFFTAVLPITLSGQCVSSSAPSGVSGTLSICNGSSTSLTVSGGTLGTGAQWKWYTGSCGGTLIDSGAVVTVSPTTTKAYWVRAEGGSCSSTTACATSTVTVNTVPATPTTSPSGNTGCEGTPAALRGYSVGNTILWYKQASGGSAVDSTASHAYYTPLFDTTHTYYLSAKSGAGCESSQRAAIALTVTPAPAAPAMPTSNSPNCGQVTLTRVGTPPTGQTWYFGSAFNMTIHNGNHGSTYVVTSSGTYYIHSRYDTTGCWGLDTVTISVVVKPRPAAPDSIYSNSPQCQGTGVTLTVVGSAPAGQTWYWQPRTVRYYTTDTGATYTVGSTSVPCIKSLDTVGCWSDDKCIGATVNPRPAVPAAATPSTATNVCSAANLSISATSTGNSIDWYTQSSGGSLLGSAASGAGFTVNPTTGGAFYAASRSAAGCVSSSRKATGVISILSLPAAPTAPAAQSICSDTAYTFVFDSVLAGSGGNQIEWSRYSSFDSSTLVSSGSDIYFTVNVGETDTLWLRSRASATGCVSGGVFTTGRVNLRPEPPTVSTPSAVESSVPYIFVVDALTGSEGDGLQWAIGDTTNTLQNGSSYASIFVEVAVGSAESLWVRSIKNESGCYGAYVMRVLGVNELFADSLIQYKPNYYELVDSFESLIYKFATTDTTEDGIKQNFTRWNTYWEPKKNGLDGNFWDYARAGIWYTEQANSGCEESQFISDWKCLGPDDDAPHRGRITEIWVDPDPVTNSDHVVAAGTGGVWEHEAGTDIWVNITDNGNIPTQSVSGLAVNPTVSGDWRIGLGQWYSDWPAQNYGMGIANRDPATGVWSIDDDFIDAVVAADGGTGTGLPIVSDVEFDKDGIFYATSGKYFAKKDGNNAYVLSKPNGDNTPTLSRIGISPENPEKILITAGAIWSLDATILYSGNGGNTWNDITEKISPGVVTLTSTFTNNLSPFTNSTTNVNGWSVVNNAAQVVPINSLSSLTTTLSSIPIRDNGWKVSYDVTIPPAAALFLKMSTSVPGVVPSTKIILLNSNNTTNTITQSFTKPIVLGNENSYETIEFLSWCSDAGNTSPLTLDNVIFTGPPGYLSYVNYDVVHNTSNGHDIVYATLGKEGGSCTSFGFVLVKYDLDDETRSETWLTNCGFVGPPIIDVVPEIGTSFNIYTGMGQSPGAISRHRDNGTGAVQMYVASSNTSHSDIRSITVYSHDTNSPNSDKIYVGNDGGIDQSITGGTSYSGFNKTGLASNIIFGFGNSETVQRRILFGAVDNGFHVSDGDLWEQVPPGDGESGAVNKVDADEGGGQKSDGSSINFMHFSSSITNFSAFNPGTPPNSFNTQPLFYNQWTNDLITASDDIYVRTSMVSPYNWTNINDGGNTFVSQHPGRQVRAVWIGKNIYKEQYLIDNSEVVVDATTKNHHNIWMHYDAGGGTYDWKEIKSSMWDNDQNYFIKHGNYQPSCVTADPDHPERVWIGFVGMRAWDLNTGEPDGRVLFSNDGGNTWEDISRGLPFFPVTKIVYQDGTDDILYAATDVGVYVWDKNHVNESGPNGRWFCFNTHQPNCVITDLQIVYCEGKLRTTTWGRGVWETDLAKVPEDQKRPLVISTNEEWDEDKAVVANVIIEAGNVLRITNGAIIRMARGTTITVEPGGKLLVNDGATITNTCGSMWGGIIVKGNKLLPQDLSTNDDNTAVSQNQGFVYLQNAHIKNAYEALRVWNPADGWVDESFSYQGGTGGIVRAVGAEFENNRRSVEFMYYKNWQGGIEMPNLSFFKNCQFNTNDEHSDEHPFSAHATMWGTSGIKFEGCRFENNDTRITDPHNLGTGIGSIDASYTVKEYHYVTQNSNSIKSSFKNLYTGVLVENGTLAGSPVYVYNSEFTDNQAGIIMSNSNQNAINGNLFTVGHLALSNGPAGHFIGAAVDNSTGFQHIGNEFNSDNGIDAPFAAIGSLLFNTGGADNQTNANTYHNISFATLANLVNREAAPSGQPQGLHGLHFFCNHNDNQIEQLDYTVYQDFVSPSHGIAHFQNSVIQGQTVSAADIFSSPNNGTVPNEHHYMNKSFFDVNYYYKTSPQMPQLNNVTGAGMVNIIEANQNRDCPSLDPDGGCIACSLTPTHVTEMKADFDTAYWAYSNELTQLNAMMDGGNTALLKLKVDTSSSGASALKDSLLAKSPYLSEAVLEAVVKRKGFFTSTQIYNILYANPDALQSEYFMQQVQDSINADYANLLRARRADTTARTAREILISTYSQEYHRLNSSILISMFHDTSGYSHAEYRHWLGKLKHPEADMAVIDDYFETGIADTALMLLDSIPVRYNLTGYQDTSYKVFKELTLFKAALRTDSISVSHLDSSEVEQLDAIAQKGDLPAARKAQGILHFFYNYPYRTTPQIPDVGYSMKRDLAEQSETEPEKIKQSVPVEAFLKVYPNPAKEQVTFSFVTGCRTDELALLVIADLQGRVMVNEVLLSDAKERVIDSKQWQNGMYLYRLTCGDKVIGSGNLSVIK